MASTPSPSFVQAKLGSGVFANPFASTETANFRDADFAQVTLGTVGSLKTEISHGGQVTVANVYRAAEVLANHGQVTIDEVTGSLKIECSPGPGKVVSTTTVHKFTGASLDLKINSPGEAHQTVDLTDDPQRLRDSPFGSDELQINSQHATVHVGTLIRPNILIQGAHTNTVHVKDIVGGGTIEVHAGTFRLAERPVSAVEFTVHRWAGVYLFGSGTALPPGRHIIHQNS